MFVIIGQIPLGPIQASEEIFTDFSSEIAQIAKQNIPSVIHINILHYQDNSTYSQSPELNLFFRYFLNAPYTPTRFKKERKGFGTGIIMDNQGHILTNYHIVSGASEIQIQLSNGKLYSADIVGTDPSTDLAVIRVDTNDILPNVVFGNSDKIDAGEWVVAIGRPCGLDYTITQGIISSRPRLGIEIPSCYQDFLQTDSAINPGNSGGPLINLKNEVIGINAARVSQTGGFVGVGFSIPSNIALHIAKELIKHGKVNRGWLGLTAKDLTLEQCMEFKLGTKRGALISGVVKNGPADIAGMHNGDVVTTYDGRTIQNSNVLRDRVITSKIGDRVNISIYRKGKSLTFTAQVGELKQSVKENNYWMNTVLGIDVRSVTLEEIRRFDLGSSNGVVIISISPESPLKEVGIEIYDVVLDVNGEAVMGLNSFADLINNLKSKQRATLLALDHRTGRKGYVQFFMP